MKSRDTRLWKKTGEVKGQEIEEKVGRSLGTGGWGKIQGIEVKGQNIERKDG